MSEIETQSAVIDYLALRKHFFFRINNIPVYDTKRKVMRRMPKGSMNGVPDILVLWNGFPVFLEIKSKIGKPSKDQLAFKEKCELQGIEYHIIKAVTDVKEIGL
jgi:hypothetical protein